MINDQPLTIVIDGRTLNLGLDSTQPLVRAVLVSLFTWRRANADDALPGDLRMGWWGDSFPAVPGDRIGSRLWLLSRAKLTPETVAQAKEYAEEALRWLVDDGVAARVEVQAERQGLQTLAIGCRIYKSDGTVPLDVRFTDVWGFLNV
ncbi:MAG: phage GP46 family protein [Aquabacterium sp.]|nr:phage GP46 family protein [Aquabacterium sp.]